MLHMLYLFMVCTGVLTVFSAWTILRSEMKQRNEGYRQLLHTRFVILENNKFLDLTRTHYVIGRRKRRCDISLEDLHDLSISKTHAVLWHDGHAFCIAPLCSKSGAKKTKKYSKILVNGIHVPPQGCSVQYGDLIQMGEHQFMLVDTNGR